MIYRISVFSKTEFLCSSVAVGIHYDDKTCLRCSKLLSCMCFKDHFFDISLQTCSMFVMSMFQYVHSGLLSLD